VVVKFGSRPWYWDSDYNDVVDKLVGGWGVDVTAGGGTDTWR